MSNIEIARAIRAKFNEAEAALAIIDALATDAFRDTLDPTKRKKAEASLARAVKALDAAHDDALEAAKSSSDPETESGGGGGK